MISIREALLAQIAAVLALVGPEGGAVFRSRVVALASGGLPARVVRPVQDMPISLATGMTARELSVDVEYHVRGDVPDQIADPFVCAGHAAIMRDPSLNGLCMRVTEGPTKWETADGDQTRGQITVTYLIKYATPLADLTRPI